MAKDSHKPSLGSISHGTLRTEDLLSAFAWELRHIATPDDKASLALCDEADAVDADSDEMADELVNELADALNEYAPPYCYFGAHEGDGSDFGFWPIWESIDDLPTVEDSDGAITLGEDCKAVNDHGNVTVYAGDGTVIWDCV